MTISDELYFGCHACGKEAVGSPLTCYECGHDRYLSLLNEAGEYPTQAQLDKHFKQYPKLETFINKKKERQKMKLYIKTQMLIELATLRVKYYKLNRSLAKIQKQIDVLNKTWNNQD